MGNFRLALILSSVPLPCTNIFQVVFVVVVVFVFNFLPLREFFFFPPSSSSSFFLFLHLLYYFSMDLLLTSFAPLSLQPKISSLLSASCYFLDSLCFLSVFILTINFLQEHWYGDCVSVWENRIFLVFVRCVAGKNL